MKASEMKSKDFTTIDPITMKKNGEEFSNVMEINLPEWLDFEVNPPLIITKEGDRHYSVKDLNGKLLLEEQEITLYNFTEKVKKNLGKKIVIDEENDVFTISEEGSIVFTRTDVLDLLIIKADLHRFYKVAEAWRKSPDFFNSYQYVTYHPMFWVRNSSKNNSWEVFNKPWFDFFKEEGKVVCALEAGEHCEPEFLTHYHDYELDVSAPSFEKAVQKLAKKIDLLYNDDGTRKGEKK